MRKFLAVCAIMLLSLGGCKMFADMPDEELAESVYKGAKAVTSNGLKIAINQSPDSAEAIKENAKLAAKIIRDNILPVFEGATTEEVLRSAVDTALDELGDKVSPTLASVINLALQLVAEKVNLPDNPAAKLDVRTRMALVGLFKGLVDGIDEAVEVEPTPAPVPAPEPAPVPEEPKLVWPKN